MVRTFGGNGNGKGGGNELPPLELGGGGETRSPADAYAQRQADAWRRIPLGLVVLVPWVWTYLAFAESRRKDLPLLAVFVTHAGLALFFFLRHRARRKKG
ncbi:hypothetical protein [Streptomyces gilvosporeus]|uniref:Uncharacterized protein n=1 Tax=Streptomyces gilvosporeus TaxID=553510 RepID=A0A1V0TS59_9ACTN|nr:hypothetical protein [Streptomyces gilvosporeus]ARF55776.1 hypothetical protein B1H19_17735 [Streptomyces gilvosporeus]